ncbi:MAG: hypothetical protein WA948_06440 [Pontixanthobacter sp.]
MTTINTALPTIGEMREFAHFAPGEQRYIRRSLDIGLDRRDAFRVWARDAGERSAIRSQYVVYQDLKLLRGAIPKQTGFENVDRFMGPLTRIAVFDLSQERLRCFSAFRFLYERLLGAEARPWLPGAFCGAAALPQIRPERRKMLLQSLSEAAATAPAWSDASPSFFPEFIAQEAA